MPMVKLGKNAKDVYCSVDWGFTNPGVMQVWIADNDGRLYLIHEIYQTQKLIGWWVERAVEINEHFNPSVFVCDPAEPSYIQEFLNAGLYARPADNKVLIGVQKVQERLKKAADGKPRFFIVSDALVEVDQGLKDEYKPTCTEQEFPGYVYPQKKDGRNADENPVKVDDHGMDCVRYLVMEVDKGGLLGGISV